MMETKNIIAIVSLIALVIVLSLIPANNKVEIIIKAPLYDVAKQINDLSNWKKWNTDLKNSDIKISGSFNSDQFAKITATYSYLVHHINPLAVLLTRTSNGSSTSSLIAIASVTDTTTVVSWSEKLTFFELMKRSTVGNYSRQTNLDNLKKWLEDVNYRYGFIIKIVPVKDTLILTAEATKSDSSDIVSGLYKKLLSFIKDYNLPAEKNYFYKTQLSNHTIAIGIPVYKRAGNYNSIKFLQLPVNGRLVEGNYSGKITNIQSIYTAIDNFILDKHLKQVAQPLQQYNIADTILQPNGNVNFRIYYPVF